VPDLNFCVEHAEAVPFAAAPLIAFRVRVENANAEELIHTVALRVQIQIETTRRGYSGPDQERLLDLFGEPNRWAQTLRPMLWTHASAVIPGFQGQTMVELQVPCTFDFNIAATKYFHALSDGDIPLQLLFSGNTFYADTRSSLQVAPISWDKEARCKLPVKVWKEMMDLYYPNSAWLRLRRDVFERLLQYKMQRGMATWEEALESVIPALEDEVVRP
jgi:hypothetical protein